MFWERLKNWKFSLRIKLVMKKLLEQIIKFLGFSGIGWILDFSTYTILSVFYKNLFVDNIIGGIVGTSFVFVFSTKYIFKNDGYMPIQVKYVIYIVYQIILMYSVSKLLANINDFILGISAVYWINVLSPTISKILVTPITMILNFLVLKKLINPKN